MYNFKLTHFSQLTSLLFSQGQKTRQWDRSIRRGRSRYGRFSLASAHPILWSWPWHHHSLDVSWSQTFRSTLMRQNLPFEVRVLMGCTVLGWFLRRMSTLDDEPSDRQFAGHACCCRWIFWGNLFGLKETCEITYYVYNLRVRCCATADGCQTILIIQSSILGPLTTCTIMSVIHPLRNLLIGVLGSNSGHPLDQLGIGLDQLGIVVFVVPYYLCFCISSSLVQGFRITCLFFVERCFGNIHYQKTSKPKTLTFQPHFCKCCTENLSGL